MNNNKTTAATGEGAQSPPPARPTYRVLQGLLALLVMYTLYVAKTLFIPIVLAVMLTLLLTPAVKWLRRYYVPRPVSALLLLALMAVPFTLLGMELSKPAQKWIESLPELSERLRGQVEAMTQVFEIDTEEIQIESVERESLFARLFGRDEEEEEPEENEESNQVMDRMTQGGIDFMVYVLSATPLFLAQVIACFSLTVFMLIFGSRLFESAITNLPQIQDKQGAHRLVDGIEQELSRYMLAVSAINVLLGFSTAVAFWALGIEDALFWGVLVGVLNFAPYVGTIIGLVMLSLAGLVQFGIEWQAAMPALVYLLLNGIEAQVVTPLVLGRHMRLNPLVLMTWIIIWAWLWGFVGVLLAVPLLVCLKLVAGQLSRAQYWVRIIETRY